MAGGAATSAHDDVTVRPAAAFGALGFEAAARETVAPCIPP